MVRKKAAAPPLLPDDLAEYRKWLVAAEQKSQEDFDKTVLSLSGGALGVSFVFLKDIMGVENIQSPIWLFGSWISWGISSVSVLASFYTSHHGLRRAIQQVDDGTIRQQKPGGFMHTATSALNATGAALFLVGVILMTVFVYLNVGSKVHERQEAIPTVTSTSSSAESTSPQGSQWSQESASAGSGARPSPVHGGVSGAASASAPAEEVKVQSDDRHR